METFSGDGEQAEAVAVLWGFVPRVGVVVWQQGTMSEAFSAHGGWAEAMAVLL